MFVLGRSRPMRMLAAGLVLASLACSEPPRKEMDEAQGALDAARAAGAERYAPEELKAAQEALERSRQAVADRDFRLALNHALDARERAQAAARQAADQKALERSQAVLQIAAGDRAIEQLEQRVKAAAAARLPAREIAPARALLASARRSVQKARAALSQEDYKTARAEVDGIPARLEAVSKALEAAPPPKPARRRR